MKICSRCKVPKDLTFYGKFKYSKDGYSYYCKDCIRIRSKEKYWKDPIKARAEKIKYGLNHKKEKSIYDLTYRANNKEKIARHKKIWEFKNKNNPIHKIKRNLRRRVHHVINDNPKSAHTFELIGCTAEEFKLHIEKQWLEGMSWGNYGPNGWHIDHIIPCFKFDLSLDEEQRKCFHYSNQRPLWAKDNLSRPRNI